MSALAVLVVIVVSGLLGGYWNHLGNLGSPTEKPSLRRELIGAFIASAIVPLFLSLSSSSLVLDVLKADNPVSPDAFGRLLVFFGFCLTAAVYSRVFVGSVSEKVLQAVKTAESAQDKVDLVNTKTDKLLESLAEEPHLEEGILPAVRDELAGLPDVEVKLVQELKHSSPRWRTAGTLAAKAGVPDSEVASALADLEERGYVSSIESRGDMKWVLSTEGMRLALALPSRDSE